MSKNKEVKNLLATKIYLDMTKEELEVVADYEFNIFKKRMNKLKKNNEQKTEWVHNLWLDYQMATETENKLLNSLYC